MITFFIAAVLFVMCSVLAFINPEIRVISGLVAFGCGAFVYLRIAAFLRIIVLSKQPSELSYLIAASPFAYFIVVLAWQHFKRSNSEHR